ncbi:MAG: hypothetical protein BHW64_00755 [Candidatus Melainabacteria bacterium LEY3_CP_29_8]|nr:MAG: hypothetical protein BHW64_00755 [Candidatus Melainabacteria bacterium LEY3_CP_29_8]
MFGNILVDKLRISKKVILGFDCSKAKAQLDLILKKRFRPENYTVNYSKTYFRVTFTPTLYLDSVEDNENKPIHNLEMISEENLLELLIQIYEVLGNNAVITWIDLTKNILIEESALMCIEAISKWKVKYPYRKHPITSRVKNTTLTLSPLTRKDMVACKNPNRRITFYPKIRELESKSKMRFLDDVHLSEEEIRREQRYKFTVNIKKITQLLTGSKNSSELTLSMLINLLTRGELYKKLDEFYSNELRQYIFYEDVHENKEVKLNRQESRIVEIVNKHNIDIAEYQYLFSDIGYKEHFNRSSKKVYYHTRGKYYNELYDKFKL